MPIDDDDDDDEADEDPATGAADGLLRLEGGSTLASTAGVLLGGM
jgi:hypothetical protein